jgi:hypothetical protein
MYKKRKFAVSPFSSNESCTTKRQPTKRVPDAGESAAISSSFLRLSIFLARQLRPVHETGQVPQGPLGSSLQKYQFLSLVSE